MERSRSGAVSSVLVNGGGQEGSSVATELLVLDPRPPWRFADPISPIPDGGPGRGSPARTRERYRHFLLAGTVTQSVCLLRLIRHDDDVRDRLPEPLEPIESLSKRVVSGRVPAPGWALVLGAAVLAGAGGVLVGRATGGEGTSSTTTTTAGASIGQPTEVSTGSLVLGRGTAAEWSFVVFDPTGRSLKVSVDDLSPPDTDLAVAVRVSDGRSLNVGRTSDGVCDRGTVHAVCKFAPTALEGVRPGTWVVRIEKNSQPDARVAITVRLDR